MPLRAKRRDKFVEYMGKGVRGLPVGMRNRIAYTMITCMRGMDTDWSNQ